MKRLRAAALPDRSSDFLRRFQREIDVIPHYEDQITAASAHWESKRKSAKATFRDVRAKLLEMHDGDAHCCYCEYSKAIKIDHVRPKSIFPRLVFDWENFVHSCGDCNTFKGQQFAIFTDAHSEIPTFVVSERESPRTPPPSGASALIDLRRENPFQLLTLDLIPPPRGRPPLYYRPLRGMTKRDVARANYTIDALGLNSRDHLIEGRASAFVAYRDMLVQYVSERAGHSDTFVDARRIYAIKRHAHRAVWEEMKRWHVNGWLARVPELASLEASFLAAPEALNW